VALLFLRLFRIFLDFSEACGSLGDNEGVGCVVWALKETFSPPRSLTRSVRVGITYNLDLDHWSWARGLARPSWLSLSTAPGR
jgi:hypothetical protein